MKLRPIFFMLSCIAILVFHSCNLRHNNNNRNTEEQLNFLVDNNKEWIEGRPVVVLLHGWGSNPQDKMNLKKKLSKHYNYIALEAPYKIGENFYSWFDIQFKNDSIESFNKEEVIHSTDRVYRFIEWYKQEKHLETKDIVVMGFSQGAVMAVELLMEYPESVSAALITAGMFGVERTIDFPVPAEVCNVDIFHAHGIYDKVIPVEQGFLIKQKFLQCPGYTFHTYKVGHEFNRLMLRDMRRWMNTRLKRLLESD